MFADIKKYTPSTIPRNDIVESIFKYSEDNYKHRFSNRIGGSVIGSKCDRKIFYGFRWAKKLSFDGRKLHLFETGNREEERIINYLKNIGLSITSTQKEFSNNFLVAKVDAIIDDEYIVEIKTMNNSNFNKLKKNGLKVGFYSYYAQCQFYMGLSKIHKCLFISKNKDNDDLYCCEVIFNEEESKSLIEKAKKIVTLEKAPEKNFSECHFCEFKEICKGNEKKDINCRTCINFTIEGYKQKCKIGNELKICDSYENI